MTRYACNTQAVQYPWGVPIEEAPREPSFSELVFSDLQRYRPTPKPNWFLVLSRAVMLPGLIAVIILRAQQCLFRSGHPRLAGLLRNVGLAWVGADFTPGMTIGKSIYIPHPAGVVIGNQLVIGEGVYIGQGVTAGSRAWEPGTIPGEVEFPIIEDGAVLLAHSTVIGGVRIGKHAQIGANSLVVSDVPDYAVMLGVPARKISSRENEVAALTDARTSAEGPSFP